MTFRYRRFHDAGNQNGGLAQFTANGAPCPGGGSPCVDTGANTIFAAGISDFSDWAAGVPLAPTAANVSVGGRVTEFSGGGIYGARVTIVDQQGVVRSARTNPFGYFRFDEIAVGETYVLEVRHKSFVFIPQVISVTDDILDLNIVAVQ